MRSRVLSNLGNVFDESGRWVEANAVYYDELDEDPTNGNAAGNITELLRRGLTRLTGQRGHLAAVYNHCTALAQSLGDRTAEIASAAAAQRQNELEQIQTEGHLSHDGDLLAPYQQWIDERRLALVEVLEGLGSDSARWDSATVSSIVTTVDTTSRDTLDGVTATEHFQSGMSPGNATFLSYWITPKTPEPRHVLPGGDPSQ